MTLESHLITEFKFWYSLYLEYGKKYKHQLTSANRYCLIITSKNDQTK